MLVELTISNFAIIEHVSLQFRSGMTVLSGETGAGKSIIIDALGILRGDKFDASFIRTNCDRARIEGIFQITQNSPLQQLLDEHGLRDEDEDQVIIFREISRDSGRTSARINGRAVSTAILRDIGVALIDIQGQHEGLSLFNAKTHLDMLDRFANLLPQRQLVHDCFIELKAIKQELYNLLTAAQQRHARITELSQLRDDVHAAAPLIGEEARLTQERARIQNGARITELVTSAYHVMTNDELRNRSLNEGLVVLTHTLHDLAKLDTSAEALHSQSTDILYALEELTSAVRAYRDRIDFDPQHIEAIEDRITVLRNLQRKYRAPVDELITQAEHATVEIERLEHSKRRTAASELQRAVEQSARDLAMPHIRFFVQHHVTPSEDGVYVVDASGQTSTVACDRTGIDKVEFMIAPNPGEEPKPLAKTASGGEGSRLFLALKSVLAQADTVETMVFDEVDTGVGGRAGAVVGEKLWQISRHHQVLCISHLAQVATFGDTHYAITKQITNTRTATQVVLLSNQDRVDEVAAMLDGHPVSEQSRTVARDMLNRTHQLKKSHTDQTVPS
ncbi:MAG: DNA repair protein RecN [Chloroflexaceae bacterium]|nr:DNA repair protein RecN [Chloroflexaceae bacterium]